MLSTQKPVNFTCVALKKKTAGTEGTHGKKKVKNDDNFRHFATKSM